MPEQPNYPYVWRWGVCGGKYPEIGKCQGMRCRVVVRGGKNSALVEFQHGPSFITSRNGLKREEAHA